MQNKLIQESLAPGGHQGDALSKERPKEQPSFEFPGDEDLLVLEKLVEEAHQRLTVELLLTDDMMAVEEDKVLDVKVDDEMAVRIERRPEDAMADPPRADPTTTDPAWVNLPRGPLLSYLAYRLDAETSELEKLVQDTHELLVREGVMQAVS